MIFALCSLLGLSMNAIGDSYGSQRFDFKEFHSPIVFHLMVNQQRTEMAQALSFSRFSLFADPKRAVQWDIASDKKHLRSFAKISHEIQEDQFTLFLGENKQLSFTVELDPEKRDEKYGSKSSVNTARAVKRGFEPKEVDVSFKLSFEWGG